jgi:DNA-binding response OmpR family regulator
MKALEYAREFKLDLILLDQHMPALDGEGWLKKLLKIPDFPILK